MNEIRLAQDTVLRLAPGIVWDETQPGCVTVRSGRTRWAAAGRRVLVLLGGLLAASVIGGACFVIGTSIGAGFSMADMQASASIMPPAASMPPPSPQPPPAQRAAGRTQQRPNNPDDPFGVR